MKRFKSILIVFDSNFNNLALINHAVDLAKRNTATLTVIDVIDEKPSELGKIIFQESKKERIWQDIPIFEKMPSKYESSKELISSFENQISGINLTNVDLLNIQEFIIKEEQNHLQQFVTHLQQGGIQANSKTLFGVPFITIIHEVITNNHDLVLISAGRKKGTDKWLGSTIMHLLRKCPCPVWVVKPTQTKDFKRILAAVDLDEGDTVKADLNQNILQLASSLARLNQSELVIVNAWRLIGESILRGRAGISSNQIEILLQETKEAHRRWLLDLLQRHELDDINCQVYLLRGEAGEIIPELANTKKIDLLVMGTVSRSGISGLLIGNTAEKVLQKVDCSILTVKPKGFITPVKVDAE